MKKRAIALFLSGMMALSLCACGGESANTPTLEPAETAASDANVTPSTPDSGFPTKPVTLLVNGAAGGAVDSNVRLLQPYLEETLGVSIVVENVEGAGGWVAWNQLLKCDPDGYTIAMANAHTMFNYYNPENNNDKTIADFDFLVNLTRDPGVIGIHPDDERFADVENIADFVEAARNYDGEILVGVAAAYGDDHMTILKLIKETGLDNLVIIPSPGSTSELKTTFYGGSCDVYVGNVGDTFNNYQNGEIKLLCVTADERSQFVPDIPTAKECGLNVVQCADRNVVAPVGLDSAVRETLVTALREAIANEQFKQDMADTGNEVYYMEGDELLTSMQNADASMQNILGLLGWD